MYMYFASFKQCSLCNNLQHILWIFYRYLTGVDPPSWDELGPGNPRSIPIEFNGEVAGLLSTEATNRSFQNAGKKMED